MAGIIEVSTLHTRLKGDISGGYGFSGILVALLGRMHPVGVAIASLFFAALTIGAQTMHVVYGLPDALASCDPGDRRAVRAGRRRPGAQEVRRWTGA